MTFHELNILPTELLKQQLFSCCGSIAWVNKMVQFFPMDDLVEMLEDAEEQWYLCKREDWLEAIGHQAAIGNIYTNTNELSATHQKAGSEKNSVDVVSPAIIGELAEANLAYKNKFGYIFIASVIGKNPEEMLSNVQQRLSNSPEKEIIFAMEEQIKITQILLQKLIA